jgi:hypothetical protein
VSFANGLFPLAKGPPLFARIRWCSLFFAGFAVNVAVISSSPSLLLIEDVKPNEEFLARAREVKSGEYAYLVDRVILFGSCLRDEGKAPIVGDVGLSVVLVAHYSDPDQQFAAHSAR